MCGEASAALQHVPDTRGSQHVCSRAIWAWRTCVRMRDSTHARSEADSWTAEWIQRSVTLNELTHRSHLAGLHWMWVRFPPLCLWWWQVGVSSFSQQKLQIDYIYPFLLSTSRTRVTLSIDKVLVILSPQEMFRVQLENKLGELDRMCLSAIGTARW